METVASLSVAHPISRAPLSRREAPRPSNRIPCELRMIGPYRIVPGGRVTTDSQNNNAGQEPMSVTDQRYQYALTLPLFFEINVVGFHVRVNLLLQNL